MSFIKQSALRTAGGTVNGNVTIQSSQAGNSRLDLQSYFETDSVGTTELIRLHDITPSSLQGNAAKAAIAFFDDASSTTQSKVWLQAHRYLNYYNPTQFSPSAVNTGTGVITLAAQNDPYVDKYQVQFSSSGTLPSGLTAATNYYIHKLSSTTFTVYTDYALGSQVTLSDQGTGTHTIMPNNDFASTDGLIFNKHQHFSVEVTKADGQTKTTRFSVPFDYDTTEIATSSANFNVNAGISRIVGSQSSEKQLQFGNPPTPNVREPDGTNIRWAIKQDNTTETGSSVGSDFRILAFNDSGAAQISPFFIKRSNKRVGISDTGTVTTPSTPLHVESSSSGNTLLFRNTATSNASAIALFSAKDTSAWLIAGEVTGDSVQRFRLDPNGRMDFGSGSAARDANFYRFGVGLVGTDNKLVATGGIGVGNSAAASTPGSVVKKIQVFDTTGASLGYIPVYSAIT